MSRPPLSCLADGFKIPPRVCYPCAGPVRPSWSLNKYLVQKETNWFFREIDLEKAFPVPTNDISKESCLHKPYPSIFLLIFLSRGVSWNEVFHISNRRYCGFSKVLYVRVFDPVRPLMWETSLRMHRARLSGSEVGVHAGEDSWQDLSAQHQGQWRFGVFQCFSMTVRCIRKVFKHHDFFHILLR